MPMPVSLTLIFSAPGAAPASARSTTSPCGVNFTALPSRFSTIWRKRVESPWRHAGSPGSTMHASSRPLRRAGTATVASADSKQSIR